jgi:type IV pilus assembly protein PilC
MGTFVYEGLNSVGQAVKGEIEAATSEEAISKVRSMGNFPTKIKERAGKKGAGAAPGKGPAGAASSGPSIRRKVGAVNKKQLTTFTRQLSTLTDAGLPLLRSLRILEQQQKPGALRVGIRLVADDVEGGSTLSDAMARHPKAFDRLYTNMVRAGELGGVLDLILQRLADFMEKSLALKRKVVGAMLYPIAVITFAVLIVMGIMIVVVPKFETIFKDMGQKLPGPTQLLMAMSNFIAHQYGWAWIIAFPVIFYAGTKLLRSSPGGAYMADNIKLQIPVFGNIAAKTSVARFTRTLGTLLAAGVPILEAIAITRDTSGNEVYSRALNKVHDGIREGESFSAPLRQAKIVEPMVVNMIDVGEETGELDKMLNKIADNYDDDVEVLVSSMVSLLEPVMVISLGIIVGFIVISLFMPLVALIQGMQGGK